MSIAPLRLIRLIFPPSSEKENESGDPVAILPVAILLLASRAIAPPLPSEELESKVPAVLSIELLRLIRLILPLSPKIPSEEALTIAVAILPFDSRDDRSSFDRPEERGV
ncbi:MAG: hypothetical protein HC847_28905 [Hydrococcus sp. RU_2_2]|nr:hypothetical protein [Hydrococcus sp. RU_2_2]